MVRAEVLKFQENGVRDVVKDVFLPWYNAYRFLMQNVQRLQAVSLALYTYIIATVLIELPGVYLLVKVTHPIVIIQSHFIPLVQCTDMCHMIFFNQVLVAACAWFLEIAFISLHI